MTRWLPRLAALVLLSALPGVAAPVRAATTCTASTSALAFGNVSMTAATDATATITITCTTGALTILGLIPVRMCLNIGEGVQGAGTGITPRTMTNTTADVLQMQLYRDASRSLVWGSSLSSPAGTPLQLDFSYGVLLIGGTGTTTQTIYARVPLQAGAAAGTYTAAFTGTYATLQYQYNEPILLGAPYPTSCTTGGVGGGTTLFPFTATAVVPAQCNLSASSDLDFGAHPGFVTAALDYTSTISMTCRKRTAWQLGLDNGQNASGTTRRMRLGATANYTTYELYRNSSRTQRWGSTLNTDTLADTSAGGAETRTVYGRVPAQTLVPGNYSDVVTVTVTY